MSASTPAMTLRQARRFFIDNGRCPPGVLGERVAHSWQRSLAAGLQPTGRLSEPEYVVGSALGQLIARHHELIAHSRPVMEYLFEQVRHAQNVVVLADASGTLMHTMGDAYFLDKAERVALACGASWHEDHRGTNAIGTAVAERAPVEIHGAEHFLERNGFLTCAAAPIFSSTGHLMGILDISGEQRTGHPHTLGLVSTAARMIENRLMSASCKRNVRLHLHAHPEGIGTVAEGIVALSDDGWIVGANRSGLAMLGITAQQLSGTPIGRVLDLRMEELFTHHRRRPLLPLQVRRRDGSVLFANIQADASTVAGMPTQRAIAPSATVTKDALAKLDTGDLRWRAAAEKTRRVLDKPIALLIQGESGVGKELFARAAHESSARGSKPFVAINCAAMSDSLIEAELFGYTSGAFTGARREGNPGRLREAHGGTLFLDEIGDMPLALQTRLLRVLQERQVTPVGGGQPVAVDFALICATNRKLREDSESGAFRSDLYYRINGLTVELPPLRERTDFHALTEGLLRTLSPERDVHVDAELLTRLSQYTWPGNLRQYANVLRTACALLGPDEHGINESHLADDTLDVLRAMTTARATRSRPAAAAQNLDELSRSAIHQALENSRGNISLAARCLGISRQTLYRKLGTKAPAADQRASE